MPGQFPEETHLRGNEKESCQFASQSSCACRKMTVPQTGIRTAEVWPIE